MLPRNMPSTPSMAATAVAAFTPAGSSSWAMNSSRSDRSRRKSGQASVRCREARPAPAKARSIAVVFAKVDNALSFSAESTCGIITSVGADIDGMLNALGIDVRQPDQHGQPANLCGEHATAEPFSIEIAMLGIDHDDIDGSQAKRLVRVLVGKTGEYPGQRVPTAPSRLEGRLVTGH